jgi:putative CocE/NonD family hydrolase
MNGARSTARVCMAMIATTALVAALTLVGPAQAKKKPKPKPSPTPTESPTPEPCSHPHPCGYRWEGPSGPFEVAPVERAQVTAEDGVVLSGWVWKPVVPEGVPVPVILISTPYTPQGSRPTAPTSVGGVPGQEFVSAGYAIALFSVRGTGDSGGCFGFKSAIEQRDQAFLVEWLATQPWSNGRVAMIGLSYPGTTPVMAAIQNPPALKTIVIAGTILDEYGFLHTPQGAQFFEAFGVGPVFTAQESFGVGDPPAAPSQETLGTTTQRVCPGLLKVNTVIPEGEIRGERDPQYWTERRFIDKVPDITAATFIVHGFQDRYGSGHAFQDDWAWQTLAKAPKRMLVGQWWHEWPNRNTVNPAWSLTDWPQRLLGWFDYWLKGWGAAAPGLGEVEFQDSSGGWHKTDAWPPPRVDPTSSGDVARRRDESVYLSQGQITPDPTSERASFRSVPAVYKGGDKPLFLTAREWRWTAPCSDPTRLGYLSAPVSERTVLAGNPHAWLNLESSAPGGLIEVQLYDVPPAFSCDDPNQMGGLRPLTEGAADLSYHSSEDYRAHAFPVGQPTHVRIDLPNVAEVLEPGHRLGVTLSHGMYYRWTSREYMPLLTVHGEAGSLQSSHLVVPVIIGGFGGQSPTLDYPPRPFTPECCR